MSAFQWEAKLSDRKDQWSVTEDQVDLLAVESVVGALSYGLPGDLLTGEGDQGLAAALTTEVVQDENGIWLELQRGRQTRETVSVTGLSVTPGGAHKPEEEHHQGKDHLIKPVQLGRGGGKRGRAVRKQNQRTCCSQRSRATHVNYPLVRMHPRPASEQARIKEKSLSVNHADNGLIE